jgi:pimeloyl-ACP methyl ester carboxylesterase
MAGESPRPLNSRLRWTLICLHGGGSGPWVFDDWADIDASLLAPDLQAGLDVGAARMSDYAAQAERACRGAPRPFALLGWSMGGLVAMMAAASVRPDALVLLEPSAPLQTLDDRPTVENRSGTFDPAQVYGFNDPKGRAESWPALIERTRGISVPTLGGPALIVFGDSVPASRGARIAQHYGCDSLHFARFNHGDVVHRPEVRQAVHRWLLGIS